ncbi:MAG: hypothetical protein Q8R24_05365 [Legionellaceae bacterium]|nr:hypothetical protein [Legionellaceae bacterium]
MSTFNNNNHGGKSQDAIRQERDSARKPVKKSQVKSTLGTKLNRPHDRNK